MLPLTAPEIWLRRHWEVVVEPRIPLAKWFEWRVKSQMRKIHAFEADLLEAQQDPNWLTNFAVKRFSQHGEDGMIEEICRRLDLDGGSLVEFGAADGVENCTRSLVETGNWSGLWIEGDTQKVDAARSLLQGRPVKVENAFVTRENIQKLLFDNGISHDFDLLVVDIDGNDWWVLQAILQTHSPKIVVVEYTPEMQHRRWVMPYDAGHMWRDDRWHGASLISYVELLRRHGMTLVATDTTGVNAFFVADRYADRFSKPGDVAAHYSPWSHLLPFGHRWKYDRTQVAPLDEANANQISIENVEVLQRHSPLGYTDILVEIENRSSQAIGSSGDTPVHLAVWWGSPSDRLVAEPLRARLPWSVPAKAKRAAFVRIAYQPGELQLSLVQEGVCWLGEPTSVSF